MKTTLQNPEKMSAIRMGLPIQECGLTFYPIRMSSYELFVLCKDALCFRMSTLPVRLMSKDFLNAIYSLEVEALKPENKNNASTGLFYRLIRLFYLSLRIDFNERMVEQSFTINEKNEIERIDVIQNNKKVSVTPMQFSLTIRSLIAMQNGIELPDESENIDLVRANNKKQELAKSGIDLDISADSLISSVAFLSHVSEAEINNWTVREFESRIKAIDRDKNYMLHKKAELSGMVKFKNGNPFPSWCYDRSDDSLGTRELSEI